LGSTKEIWGALPPNAPPWLRAWCRLCSVVRSGVTRGLRQGGQNLAEGGPLATDWVAYEIISSQKLIYVIPQKQEIVFG